MAVTTDRTVSPTSPLANVYELPLAPLIVAQPAPELLQSCHAYEYDVGLFDHDPFVVDNVSPCCAVPLTTGTAEFDGAAGADPLTTAVAALDADPDPPAFDAVTTDRTVCPTSPLTNVYELPVAPPITEQPDPEPLQSSHTYE